jgi:hypothetical protein
MTYPNGNAGSSFVFIASPSLAKRDVQSWADIQGISITISGNVNPVPAIEFKGRYGGSGGALYDHNHWRFEHKMAANATGVPEIIIDFA